MNSFSEFIKIIGKGPRRSKDLSEVQAEEAMDFILSSKIPLEQISAFLIALRMKGETESEMIGLTKSLKKFCPKVETKKGLCIAPPFDGKTKTALLSPFVAKLFYQIGLNAVVIGGNNIPTKNGLTSQKIFEYLKWPQIDKSKTTSDHPFGYFDLSQFCPELNQLTKLRNELGLRTVLNTIEKLLNPLNLSHVVTSVYHGRYLDPLCVVAPQVGQSHFLCLQGTEGSPDVFLSKRSIYKICDGKDRFQNEWIPQKIIPSAEEKYLESLKTNECIESTIEQITSKTGPAFLALIETTSLYLKFLEPNLSAQQAFKKGSELCQDLNVI